MIRGVFERRRFLDLLQHFIVFDEDPDTGVVQKVIAGYHQYHAVNAAVDETSTAHHPGLSPRASSLRRARPDRSSG